MFSIPSISKILVFLAIIALVWVGFRLIGRLDQARKQEARRQKDGGRVRGASRQRPEVEETVRCRVCGAFVAARGATSCGRADCPY
jgi:uncharacterized protein